MINNNCRTRVRPARRRGKRGAFGFCFLTGVPRRMPRHADAWANRGFADAVINNNCRTRMRPARRRGKRRAFGSCFLTSVLRRMPRHADAWANRGFADAVLNNNCRTRMRPARRRGKRGAFGSCFLTGVPLYGCEEISQSASILRGSAASVPNFARRFVEPIQIRTNATPRIILNLTKQGPPCKI